MLWGGKRDHVPINDPKMKLKLSFIEKENVTLDGVVIAPPGAAKGGCIRGSVIKPIASYLEKRVDEPILLENVSEIGAFLHAKASNGGGLIFRDEAHEFFENLGETAKDLMAI